MLCGALTGDVSSTLWQGKQEVIDFYSVKGILQTLFNKIGLSHLEFIPMSDYKNLHPGQSAYIVDRNDIVGFMGNIPVVKRTISITGIGFHDILACHALCFRACVSCNQGCNIIEIIYPAFGIHYHECI